MAESSSNMRHLEPRQLEPRRAPDEPPRKKSLMPLAAGVLALAIAGGWGLTHYYSPAPVDAVGQQEQAQRLQSFQRSAPVKVAFVPQDRVKDAVTAMNLPAADEQALRQDLQAPANAAPGAQAQAQKSQEQVRLIEVTVWDSDAPDGDVVSLSSGGFTREVVLAKTPTIVYMPYRGGGGVQVTGVYDGGGGITLGIRGSETPLMLPILSVGQVITVPVRLP